MCVFILESQFYAVCLFPPRDPHETPGQLTKTGPGHCNGYYAALKGIGIYRHWRSDWKVLNTIHHHMEESAAGVWLKLILLWLMSPTKIQTAPVKAKGEGGQFRPGDLALCPP